MFSANICGIQMDAMYGLYLPVYAVPTPEVQTNYIDIPGRDGQLDRTAPDGIVHYKNREWSLEFRKTGANVSGYDLPILAQRLYSDLHGRSGSMIFDDDANYKWIGRVFIDEVRCENNGLIIVDIRVITEPFRYGVIGIKRSLTLTDQSQTVLLQNRNKPIIPTITITGDDADVNLIFTIKGDTHSAHLSAGVWNIPDLILFDGITVISVSGVGNISFEYPEAML